MIGRSLGEVLGGLMLALVARRAGMPPTFATSAVLVGLTGTLVWLWHPERQPQGTAP